MSSGRVGAIVLAAGQSRRMGRPKMLLPWGSTTVIGRVTAVLLEAGAQPVIVICGALENEVKEALADSALTLVKNNDYLHGDMLASLQRGIEALPDDDDVEAVLVVLGDQPQIETALVRQVLERYQQRGAGLIVPSFEMRRGHPWLVSKPYWADILKLDESQSLRDFLGAHSSEIEYVNVSTSSILKDLDTPEDYKAENPGLLD